MDPNDIFLYALSISASITIIAVTVFVCAAVWHGIRKGMK